MSGTPWERRERVGDAGPASAALDSLARPAQLIGWFSLLGGLLGTVNLGVDGVLRPGGWTLLYAGVMTALVLLGATLLLTRGLAPRLLPLVVLSGHLVYVVVTFCVVDAELFATPLMLLFSVLTGSLVLGLRTFVLNCLLVVPVLAVAMSPRYDDPVGLGVQVVVHASILVITAVGVFLLRRRAEQLLERTWQLSRTDELTGLPNRRQVSERAPELVARARRSGEMVAVLVLDVDRFKSVNDEHGHAVGDAVLREVGRALMAEVRADELAARTGGEEMLVVACVPDLVEATRLAQRLQEAVRGCASPVPVTCSTGLAVGRPPAGADAAGWLWHRVDVADGAMYRAKREGRDRVVVDGARADVALDGAP
jgi:diguanylate cyclase (GGDEF)-like protein